LRPKRFLMPPQCAHRTI